MAESVFTTYEYARLKRDDQESFWDGWEYGANQTRMVSLFDDFFTTTLPTVTTGHWVVTETGAGTEAITDEHGGILLLTNAAADNDAISMQFGRTADGTTGESIACASGRTIWYETRLKVSDATQTDWLAGLVVTDTTPLANTDGIFFRKDEDDTQVDVQCAISSVASTMANVFTCGTSYMKLGFKVSGLSQVSFWINDVKVATLTSNIPTTELRPTFHIQNGEAVSKTMSIDYMFVGATR